MTEKDIKIIECESDEDQEKQTKELLENIVNSLEGKSFIYTYAAANIRLKEMARYANVTEAALEKMLTILKTASYMNNNQMKYLGRKVVRKDVESNMIDVVEICDKIAEKCQGYCDNVVIYTLTYLKNYLIDMEELSDEDIEILDDITKNLEGNLKRILEEAKRIEANEQ